MKKHWRHRQPTIQPSTANGTAIDSQRYSHRQAMMAPAETVTAR